MGERLPTPNPDQSESKSPDKPPAITPESGHTVSVEYDKETGALNLVMPGLRLGVVRVSREGTLLFNGVPFPRGGHLAGYPWITDGVIMSAYNDLVDEHASSESTDEQERQAS